MPTYEYECDKCEKHFDIFQRMADDPIKKCPECGGTFHRLIGMGSAVLFKGAGFYETDYKKKPKKEDRPLPSCPAASKDCKGCPSNKKGKND